LIIQTQNSVNKIFLYNDAKLYRGVLHSLEEKKMYSVFLN